MRAADTNLLVRVLTGDDPKQLEAAEAFIAGGAWVSTVVVAETVWVLGDSYELSNQDLASAIEMLIQQPNLIIQDSEAVAAALELFRARPSLGFSDCLILELARRAGHLPLGTFDRALGRVEGAERLS
jgi:predicted nucleic-acid-binding protein